MLIHDLKFRYNYRHQMADKGQFGLSVPLNWRGTPFVVKHATRFCAFIFKNSIYIRSFEVFWCFYFYCYPLVHRQGRV